MMRIGISNIAWDPAEDEAVAELLRRYEIDAVDVAPSKYFPAVRDASRADVLGVKQAWADRGFEVTGMQALMFGTKGLNLFGPSDVRDAMLQHLEAVCQVGAGLGCRALVFGSPKNRDRAGLSDDEAERLAIPFFRRVGEIARAHDVVVCVEPNPACYGSNFLMTSAETAAFVRKVDSPGVRMQLDTGAVTISEEQPHGLLVRDAELIGHVHLSEPGLVPLGDGACDHRVMARCVREHLGDSLLVIEMVATQDEPHLEAIERALKVVVEHYRGDHCAKGAV